MKKYLFLAFICLAVIACAGKKDGKDAAVSSLDGKKLFKQNCVLCHGEDGKLGLNNSKDLTKSVISNDDRINMITNGKNAMTGFANILSKEEIKAVAAYTFKLKK